MKTLSNDIIIIIIIRYRSTRGSSGWRILWVIRHTWGEWPFVSERNQYAHPTHTASWPAIHNTRFHDKNDDSSALV